jgi:hypothetical protein
MSSSNERDFGVSAYATEKDNAPKSLVTNWPGLFGHLSRHEVRSEKLGGECWSAAVYPPGATRGNANVESISVAFFDIDHTTQAELDALGDRLDEAKQRFIIHSTFSHTHEHPRCRLVLDLPRSVTPKEWKLLFPRLVKKFGIPADEKAKDPARILFAPSCPPGSVPFVRVGVTS